MLLLFKINDILFLDILFGERIMASKTKKRGNAPRNPNSVIYAIAVFVLGLYMRLVYRLKIDRSAIKGLKEPIVVLGNHACNLDFITMALTVYPTRLNFMVSTYFFQHFILGFLLRFMGEIPKRQFVPDAGAIRACLAAAKNGRSIGIFPEGQVTYTGATVHIDPSIAKLIKKLGMTVVAVKTNGNHLTYPKWAGGKTYRGAMRSAASVVIRKDEIAALSPDEIYARVCGALAYNDYEWQREAQVKYRPSREALGLQSILYRCPVCNRDFVMQAEGKRLFCTECGYEVELLDSCLLAAKEGETVFDTPVDWFNWEHTEAEKEVADGAFPYSAPCTLYKTVSGKFGYTLCGSGTMTADWRGLHFEGEKEGEPFVCSALVEHQTGLTHNVKESLVDIAAPECHYGFAPADDPRKMMKFISFYSIARLKYESDLARG